MAPIRVLSEQVSRKIAAGEVIDRPYSVVRELTDNAETLAVGVTGSIEPTICIYGEFGVRLEDHFYVTADGAAWHTEPSPSIDDPFGRVA